AGPWVADVLRRAGLPAHRALRLVKGSHIVVPRLYEGEHAYLLQNDDGRIVFVIPFERAFSLIGTTELPFTGDPATAAISEEEIAYLCRAVARWFAKPPGPAEVVWHYAGVRARDHPALDAPTAERLARSYGSEAREMLRGAQGEDFGHGFCETELRWLVEKEWAATAEDVLWRRTKLGLVMAQEQVERIGAYLARVRPASLAAGASAPAGQ